MIQTQQKQQIENYIQAYNDFDIAGMIRDLHDDLVFENISNGQVDLRTEGKAAFVQQAEAATQYFRQRRQTITSWDVQADKVRIGIDYEGVLAIALPNGLQPGDTLQLQGQSEFVFQDARIIAITDIS